MRLICFLIVVFITLPSAAQIENDVDHLFLQAEKVLYTNPAKAISVGEYILKNTTNNNELLKTTYLLTRGHYVQGDINNALKTALSISNDNDAVDEFSVRLNICIAEMLNELDLTEISKKYLDKAILQTEQLEDPSLKKWVLTKKNIQENLVAFKKEDTAHNIAQLEKIKNTVDSNASSSQIENLAINIATMHLKKDSPEAAFPFINEAYLISREQYSSSFLELKSLQLWGDYLYKKQLHKTAIDTLKSALAIAQKLKNAPAQGNINNALATNYLAINELELFKETTAVAKNLNNTIGNIESEAINTAYNHITKKQNQALSSLEQYYYNYSYILGSMLLVILILWYVLKTRYTSRVRQFESFILYFEKRNTQDITDEAPVTKLVPKSLNIPKETVTILLDKLKAFENSTQFTSQDMSLAQLASKFDTNTKYLSEVINVYKDKNFNSYINELRIDYIIDKLKNDKKYRNYKISYLAKESGFSSHSSFATVFKSIAGISPTAFINLLKTKKDSAAA